MQRKQLLDEARQATRLLSDIKDLLENRFSLEKEVTFSVKDGQVVLNGYISSLWARENLPKEIRRIVGVTGLENHLKVR